MKAIMTVAAFITLVLSSVLVGPIEAATIVVDDDAVQCPGAAFATIQGAVNAAAANDTIEVCAGTYFEEVIVDSTRTGLRLTASGLATLEAPLLGISPVGFDVQATGVQIDRFEVSGYAECGIRVSADRARIQNNHVHHNVVNICVEQSTGTSVRNNIVDAAAFDGIDALEGTATRISGNRVSSSGEFGILVSEDSGSKVDHNLVIRNQAAGIALHGSTGGSIENNTVRDGVAYGIIAVGNQDVEIVLNSVQNHGLVGIAIDDCVRDVQGCTVSRNNVTRSNGLGITSFLGGIALTTSDGATITQNAAHRNGLADCVWDGAGSNVFLRNSCGVDVPSGAWD